MNNIWKISYKNQKKNNHNYNNNNNNNSNNNNFNKILVLPQLIYLLNQLVQLIIIIKIYINLTLQQHFHILEL